jgi:hypothetical protein
MNGLCQLIRIDTILRGSVANFDFRGQNPENRYQQFNDLQTTKRSKKQICDRTE